MKRLLVFALSAVMALLVLEGGLRVLGMGPRTRARMHAFDATLGWKKLPGVDVEHRPDRGDEFLVRIVTSSQGLRDDEVPAAKRPGEERILFVGDSFTLGYTVDRKDLFVDILERDLRQEGRDVTCINGGTEGWSTDQAALFFTQAGRSLQPDLLVYVFYQNDVYWNLKPAYLEFPKPLFGKQPGGGFAPANLPLADTGAHEPSVLEQIALLGILRRPRVPMARVRTGDGETTLPEEFCVSLKDPPAFVTEAFATTEGILRWLKDRCTESSVRLALLLIPDKSEIYKDDLRRLLSQYRVPERDWDAHRPTRELRRIAEGLGIPCLDPTAGFVRSASGPMRLYYEEDRHLSPQGNRALADQLRRTLPTWLPK